MNIPKISLKQYFLINIVLLLYNSQIKIPLTFFPVYSINFTTPANIIQYYIEQRAYANFEIGSPKQTVQIPLKFDSNDFYIIDNDILHNDTTRFSGFKLYDSSKSSNYMIIEEDFRNGYDFDLAQYAMDTFYFNNKSYSVEFYSPLDYDYCDSGGIGMQLNPPSNIYNATPNKERTFIEKLKKRELAKEYSWSIFYNTKENTKQDEGFLLIGCLPHEINDNDLGYYKKGTFKENNTRRINLPYSGGLADNILEIDLIYGYEGNNKSKKIEDFSSGISKYKRFYLDYNSGGIKVPKNLQSYYQRVFEEYILKGECFSDTFNGKNNLFYYCKNDKNIINEIKSVFPGINLNSRDLEYNFTIEADDLFIEEKDFVFCLVYFSTYYNQFSLGKPFLKKYQFTINLDQKTLTHYNISEEENQEEEYQEEENQEEENQEEENQEEENQEEYEEEDQNKEEEEEEQEEEEENNNGEGNKYDKDNKNNLSLGVILGITFGGIVFILLIAFIIYKFYLKERTSRTINENIMNNKNDYSIMKNMEEA